MKLREKLKKLAKKAEKWYMLALPVMVIGVTFVHFISVLPTVEPIWHGSKADPLLLSETPVPVDMLGKFLSPITQHIQQRIERTVQMECYQRVFIFKF